MRFVSYGDRKSVDRELWRVYTAATAEAARIELDAFADSNLGKKYPATVATWQVA